MLPPNLLGDRYEQALRLAASGHREQERRGSRVPYVAHPFAVAAIVERAGGDEATVIAALLHDLVEDTAIPLEAIRHQFGDEVAATVLGCSEIKRDEAGRTRSWEDRKRDHLVALGSASASTRAVVLADKLHNLISIRIDLEANRPVWSEFHASRDRVLWYFGAVIDQCVSSDPCLAAIAAAGRAELERVRAMSQENRDFAEPMT